MDLYIACLDRARSELGNDMRCGGAWGTREVRQLDRRCSTTTIGDVVALDNGGRCCSSVMVHGDSDGHCCNALIDNFGFACRYYEVI